MRNGYESKQSYQEERQLRKAQWRKLALGVALMTSCWQLGWMPMTEAADVVKKEITQEVLNTEDTIKDYTQEATNLTTTDGGVYAAMTPSKIDGPGGGKTITLTNNTVHLTGATINDTRNYRQPHVIAVQVTLGNNQSGSQNESYVLSGNAITLDGTIKTTGNTNGRLEGAWIICNNDADTYKATAITATDNSVTINADTASSSIGSDQIAGVEIGTANTSLAEGNKVKITSGNFTNGNLIIAGALPSDRAGNSTSLRAIGNTVEISGGQFVAGIKIVGAIERGTNYFNEASQNVVTISGGTFDADTTIIGGKGTTANKNIVNINAAINVYRITGGEGTTSEGNTVNITGGTVNFKNDGHDAGVYGGNSTSGNADSNKVNMTAGEVKGTIIAGNAKTGSASENILTISGGSIGEYAVGGRTESTGNANKNEVHISGGTVSSNVLGGESREANAEENKVTVSDSANITGAVIGGRAGSTAGAQATGNKVTVTGGTINGNANLGSVSGALADAANTNAISNTVEISGGTLQFGVYGGNVYTSGTAESNTVTISDGTVNGNTYGGYTKSGTAANNTINLNGGTFGDSAVIYGGKGTTAENNTVNVNAAVTVAGIRGGDGTTSSGNTLNLGATGIIVGESGVSQAQTIAITNNVAFADGATVLKAASISDMGTFDITATNFTGLGTMTLLESETDNNLNSVTLKYDSGDPVTLDSTNTSKQVKSSTGIQQTTTTGVKLTYDDSHDVKLDTNNYNKVSYTITNSLSNVDISGWTSGTTELPEGWEPKGGITITGTIGSTAPTTDTNILTTTKDGFFDNATIADDIKYKTGDFSETAGSITLSGTQSGGVKADGKNLAYVVKKLAINSMALGETTYDKGAAGEDKSSSAYNYSGVTALDTSNFKMNMTADQAAAAQSGDSMTLLKANDTLVDIDEQVAGSVINYTDTPADGVTETGTITGSVKASGGNVTYTVTDKRASNLTFGAVNWTGSDALVTRPDGVSYADATVDATNISFSGVKNLTVGDAMTLIGAYDGDTLNAQGEKFTAGMSVVGTGKMSLDDDGNVIYTVSSVSGSEQSHNTLMGAAASIAALSMGNEFIDSAMEGLALPENIGKDGISCYAKIGGGKLRQQTGSHVNVNTWNAILALGHKNEQKKSTTEYGAFFEYGRGNYTTHNDNVQNGDGKAHYTGGGLLGKWASKDGLYVEGSFRAGNVREDAQNLLRDDTRAYSYNTSATYYGFHLGVGKQLAVAKDSVVDVYGKYFYNHKNGVDFTVNGDQYKIDALTSQVARLGVRYTLKRDKWNFYGDLAYEHELDGKAKGRVNGATIRGTDTSGGSARLELGATLLPTEKSPWSLDLNATGFAGKKRGISGGVSLKYLF
ncbi:hypothetical protein SELR_21290 [Selenomonas ruminantium subsp. lactilytica TAM6421]|uniref:Autotransporter domain-containing protein n=2 Tax=Selenomonas ruminantium TaxID=971 RepID=I0GSV0_SELRL|nr:hypothetical protein SELR_21290 [Selenomonas ruminantium subsp. lactilytica TAM6421]